MLQNNLLFTVDETEVCLSFPESHAIKQSCNMGFYPKLKSKIKRRVSKEIFSMLFITKNAIWRFFLSFLAFERGKKCKNFTRECRLNSKWISFFVFRRFVAISTENARPSIPASTARCYSLNNILNTIQWTTLKSPTVTLWVTQNHISKVNMERTNSIHVDRRYLNIFI